MPDFDITIKTPTELAGAVAAGEALERDIGKAKALGQEFGALQAKLEAVKSSIEKFKATQVDSATEAKSGEEAYLKEMEALGLNADGSKKAAEETDKLGLSHRQLHGVLDTVAPGLARMASFLQSGFTAAIGIALVAFAYGKEIRQAEGKKQGLDTAAETTKADYDADKAIYEEHVKADKDLTAEIAKLTAQLAGQKAENAKLGDLHNQTAETKAAGQYEGAVVKDVIKEGESALSTAGKGQPAINALVASHQRLAAFITSDAGRSVEENQRLVDELRRTDQRIDQLEQELSHVSNRQRFDRSS